MALRLILSAFTLSITMFLSIVLAAAYHCIWLVAVDSLAILFSLHLYLTLRRYQFRLAATNRPPPLGVELEIFSYQFQVSVYYFILYLLGQTAEYSSAGGFCSIRFGLRLAANSW